MDVEKNLQDDVNEWDVLLRWFIRNQGLWIVMYIIFMIPELLPYGVRLKKAGKNVVFDSHEDVPGKILDKEWIPWTLRKVISIGYKMYETQCVKCFDAVVAATPHIAAIFKIGLGNG